jgi:hypothetical protein
MLDQALIDDLSVAAFDDFGFDVGPVRFRRRCVSERRCAGNRAEVGGHFGRFLLVAPGLAADLRDRFGAVTGFTLDPALGLAKAHQSDDRFSFRHAQFVHSGAFAPRTSEPTTP